jgi:ubiquitin carboxyl-terminal hydrolase 5/13
LNFDLSGNEIVRMVYFKSALFSNPPIFCFRLVQEYPGGIYVCLRTFNGFGEQFVQRNYNKTGSDVYLHIRRVKKLVKVKETEAEPEKKVTKMAIGVEGGFDVNGSIGRGWKVETEDHYQLAVFPGPKVVPYPHPDTPEMLNMCVSQIIAMDSASKLQELEAVAGTWDGEERRPSPNAENLSQLPNPKPVPPSGWKCERCDKVDNLWLNLTDGSILCGRKFFDGSGGNNHAIEHYNSTGKLKCCTYSCSSLGL